MFNFLVVIFDVVLYKPLFNFLIAVYNYLPGHDFGVAIIILTIVIKLILYPVSVKAVKSQKVLQDLQPKIQEIQKKFKDNKEMLAKETLELYRKEKINPFSGLFLALVQFPVLIALYRVFWLGLKPTELGNLYSFVLNPGHINSFFLTIIDLSKANLFLAVAAGVLQFWQTKMVLPKEEKKKTPDMASMMQKQMLYFFPFVTVVILMGLPSALGLYWVVSSVFSIVQQYYILKNKAKN